MSLMISSSLKNRLSEDVLKEQFLEEDNENIFSLELVINNKSFEILSIEFFSDFKFKADLILNKEEYNTLTSYLSQTSDYAVFIFGKEKIKPSPSSSLFIKSVQKEDDSLIKMMIINNE